MSRLKLKFGERVEEPVPPRPGFGKTLAECKTLHEVSEFMRLHERAVTEGRVRDLHARCPHCHRKFDVGLIDGLVLVPDGPGDPVRKVSKVIYCPNTAPVCGKQFKLDPPKNFHFEEWPGSI